LHDLIEEVRAVRLSRAVREAVLAAIAARVVDARQLDARLGETFVYHPLALQRQTAAPQLGRRKRGVLATQVLEVQPAHDLRILIRANVDHELAVALERVDVMEREERIALVGADQLPTAELDHAEARAALGAPAE